MVRSFYIRQTLHVSLDFNKQADFDTVREIKEKLCYVAYDVEKENKLGAETTALVEKYKLPDGKWISVSIV